MKRIRYSTAAVFLALLASPSLASANEQSTPTNATTSNQLTNLPQQDVLIGSGQAPTADLVALTATDPSDQQPSVTLVDISGQPNPNQTGTAYFDDITIDLVGHKVTDDHFLTEEGLYWSDRTQTQLIKGSEQGQLNDASTFGVQNTPTNPVTAYSINVGDSGRLTHVGKTKSGIELDLIWTVLSSDRDDWLANSGYNDGRVKGLGFAGEQSIPGASGNAIVVLYNEASHLNLHYQLVKHGTTEEQPVILSFISTDIDAAQGVKTNLANLAEVIPQDANLIKTDGIIYDRTPGVAGLNGSVDLPNGGYLGAGFLSHFDYHFFSPAPERAQDAYAYPIAVRYDIFGSSLQAKLNTRLTQQIVVSYQTTAGQALKPEEYYQGFQDETYQVSSIALPNHRLVDVKKDTSNQNLTKISFIYERDYTLILDFVDDNGQSLQASSQVTGPAGQTFRMEAPVIDGYSSDTIHQGTITNDQTLRFVYQKVTPVQPSQPTNPTQPSHPSQPTNPSQPNNPNQPTNPSQPNNPSQPTNPAQPSSPSQPISPTQPSNSNPSANPVQPSTPAQPTGPNPLPTGPQLTIGGVATTPGLVRPNTRPSTQPTNANQTPTAVPPINTQPHWIMSPAVQAIPWQNSVVAPAVRANVRPVTLPKYKPGHALSEAMEHGLVSFPKSNPTLMEKDLAKHWFGINTGFTDPVERDAIMAFIHQVGKAARQAYPNNPGAVNREIAQSLAHSSYADDTLQKLLNEYGKPLAVTNLHEIGNIISEHHTSNSSSIPIDFAHIMTTLSSLEKQDNFLKDGIRALFSLEPPFPIIGPYIRNNYLTKLPSGFAFSYKSEQLLKILRLTKWGTDFASKYDSDILQQNSLLGDVLTNMPLKDVLSDMDAIILAKHPKFRDLPQDEKLLTYYSQPNLDAIRLDLFLDSYSDNPTVARTKLAAEMLLATLTAGGILALGYGIFGKGAIRRYENGENAGKINYKETLIHFLPNTWNNLNTIRTNLHQLDTHVFNSGFQKFVKDPLKTSFNYAKEVLGYGKQQVVKKFEETKTTVTKFVNKNIVKPFNQFVATTITPKVNKTKTFIKAKIVTPVKTAGNQLWTTVTNGFNKLFKAPAKKSKSTPLPAESLPVLPTSRPIIHNPQPTRPKHSNQSSPTKTSDKKGKKVTTSKPEPSKAKASTATPKQSAKSASGKTAKSQPKAAKKSSGKAPKAQPKVTKQAPARQAAPKGSSKPKTAPKSAKKGKKR